MSYTPGPWSNVSDVLLTDSHPSRPWRVYVSSKAKAAVAASNGASMEEAQANARLIAAAPDLLEALELAVATCYEADLSSSEDGGWLTVASAAIKKARGE